ncbi:MAG TPA: tautomerase family protein [Thermoanaerobaculia bacterium]|jgi:4-oxalocrotonate tautomerase
MSIMKVELIEGAFTAEKKAQMITTLTDAIVQFEGEQARETTLVLLNEVKSGDWGKGGVPLTAQAVMPSKASKA